MTGSCLDREKDPLEVKNFYGDPAYATTVKELHAELDRLRKQVGDTGEPPRAAHGNQPFAGEPQPPPRVRKAQGKKS